MYWHVLRKQQEFTNRDMSISAKVPGGLEVIFSFPFYLLVPDSSYNRSPFRQFEMHSVIVNNKNISYPKSFSTFSNPPLRSNPHRHQTPPQTYTACRNQNRIVY